MRRNISVTVMSDTAVGVAGCRGKRKLTMEPAEALVGL